MTGDVLDPFASLWHPTNDVGADAQPERETGEAADEINLAFASVSQMHRMIDGRDRGDPMDSLRAAKAELLRRIGYRRDGARTVPSWLRSAGIALTARGSAIRVNVHPVTRQDEREIAQIPRTVQPPGVGTRTPVIVEHVGDIAAQDDDEAGDALRGAVDFGLGVGEDALARMGGVGAAAATKALNGRETSWDAGDPNIDPAALAELAKQAGVKLDALSNASSGTASKVFGTMGEGLQDAGIGAGIGASIGTVIPGIGTVIGGAIGAIGGAIVGVVHHLVGEGQRELTAKERHILQQGLHSYKTHHRPGAFQDAVLQVYHPDAYQRLRAQRRLPTEIEAQLLKKHAYAPRAKAIHRHFGTRMRRELAYLPHAFRTLIGLGAVTGHARELNFALHRALVKRARLATHAAPALMAPPPEPPDAPVLPAQTAMPGSDAGPESAVDQLDDLPIVENANDETADRAHADTGEVLDDLSKTLEQSRRAQRRYLRDSWVKDTWLGDFLRLDEPDDPSAPPVAPALWPSSGGPPPVTVVPEPDAAAPPTNAEEARVQILANPPRLPPTRWEPLQAPVQVYFWDPFDRQWTRVGDSNGNERAKALVLLMIVSFHFPVTYCLLHTSRGNEVIRAVKNADTEPSGNDRLGEWRAVGSGVSRMWSPQFTFYARTFGPGEAMRFDLGRPADGETDSVTRTGANERGILEASGPMNELAVDTGDPFRELRAERAWPRDSMPEDVRWTFEAGKAS